MDARRVCCSRCVTCNDPPLKQQPNAIGWANQKPLSIPNHEETFARGREPLRCPAHYVVYTGMLVNRYTAITTLFSSNLLPPKERSNPSSYLQYIDYRCRPCLPTMHLQLCFITAAGHQHAWTLPT
jgi:hypothetical protein